MDESAEDRYDVILYKYLRTALGPDFFYINNDVVGGSGSYEVFPSPTVDVNDFFFKIWMDKNIKPEKYFIKFYIDGCFKSKIICGLTRQTRMILHIKNKKA